MKLKNILVMGGNGYVGKSIIKKLSTISDVKTISIQRSQINEKDKIQNIEYIKGDALKPESFVQSLRDSDVIIHTIGTLLDSTILKCQEKNSEGSYEQINYETAKNIAELANSFTDKKRRFIYLSANRAPPFLDRYLDTKLKAEMFLQICDNLEFFSFRPGFIIDKESRFYSEPFGHLIDQLHTIQNDTPLKNLSNLKLDFLNRFIVEKPILKSVLVNAICEIALFGNQDQKNIFTYNEMNFLSDNFQARGIEK
jgi:nucleoside-diphosphate-sugar epimerase